MSGATFNPELGEWVVDENRPFPQITEHPGIPGQPGLKEAFEPIMQTFFDRFGGAEHPVIANFDRNGVGDRYGLVINRPDALWASFGHNADPSRPPEWSDYGTWRAAMENESTADRDARLRLQQYGSVQLFFNAAYHIPSVESLEFNHSNHNHNTRSKDRSSEWGYHFGVCAHGIPPVQAFGLETVEGVRSSQSEFQEALGKLTVGTELLEEDLSTNEREHVYWTNVILEAYFKFRTQRGDHPSLSSGSWLTRAPSLTELQTVVRELNPKVPDVNSTDLAPFLLHSARQAMKSTVEPRFREGEQYTVTHF